jgi:predicted transposase YdaD
MNMEENSLSHIHLVKDDLVGYHDWRGKLDLFNIVMIGLSKELPQQDEQYELHRLLGALFAQGLTAGQRLNIIKEEYDIPIEQNIEQEVDVMCNLSQGIKEAGIAEGRVEGRSEGRAEEIIETGYEFGLSEQDILERLQKKLSISLQKAQEYLLMFGKRTV